MRTQIKLIINKKVEEYLEKLINEKNLTKNIFLECFKENPLKAFRWAESDIETISLGELAEIYLKYLQNYSWEKIKNGLTEEILRKSQYLNHSTSVLCNLIDDIRRKNQAQLLEGITKAENW